MAKKPTKEQYERFKSRLADPNVSDDIKAKFRPIVEKFKDEFEKVGGEVEKEVKKVEKDVTPAPKKRGRKKGSTNKSQPKELTFEEKKEKLAKDLGKTEEECENILAQYKDLRAKSNKRKAKEKESNAKTKKNVKDLKKQDKIIEGTNEKTADTKIEETKKDVVGKIEKEIEKEVKKVEKEVEKEVKPKIEKEVKENSPKKSKPEQKKEVEQKVEKEVEKKVKEAKEKKTKVVVKKIIIDTTDMLDGIAKTLGQFDKDSQKEFLTKLRSDIDKLLSKYMYGGDVSGATQTLDITQSNMSASSVNPTKFSTGGMVEDYFESTFVYDKDEEDELEDYEAERDYAIDKLDEIMSDYKISEDDLEELLSDRRFDDIEEVESYFEDAYRGQHDDDEAYAYDYVDQIGGTAELGNDTIERYFDYKKFGDDLSYDMNVYGDHYFDAYYNRGGKMKQGYNDRMDESLGMRNRGKKSQSFKSRRNESKGMNRAMGNRPYKSVRTMDKMNKGGGVENFDKVYEFKNEDNGDYNLMYENVANRHKEILRANKNVRILVDTPQYFRYESGNGKLYNIAERVVSFDDNFAKGGKTHKYMKGGKMKSFYRKNTGQ